MVNVPPKTRPRLFLIDGYALIYRAFFAMISRPLITTRGENTSAAFGFTRFIMNILEDHGPDYLAVVLDAGNSKRTERYPAYKATRNKMPPDLQVQLPRINALVEAFRIPVITLPDHEADDVIGTLATRASQLDLEAVIVSDDAGSREQASRYYSLLYSELAEDPNLEALLSAMRVFLPYL